MKQHTSHKRKLKVNRFIFKAEDISRIECLESGILITKKDGSTQPLDMDMKTFLGKVIKSYGEEASGHRCLRRFLIQDIKNKSKSNKELVK